MFEYGLRSPNCALGLQLCKCRLQHSVSNSIRDDTHVARETSFTSTESEHRQRNMELVREMTRHNRPSLSKRWSEYAPAVEPTQTPLKRIEKIRALRPITKDFHHQDSLFGNSFQSKSFFVVHPEWLSETIDNTDPKPLHRPPWPWEQPRYRQNIQLPITYKAEETEEDKNESKTEDECTNTNSSMEMDPRMCLPIGYTFTQPGIDITKPYQKQTQFGAPLVDTSVYKLGY